MNTNGKHDGCLIPNCPRKPGTRGVCRIHYQSLQTRVAKGSTTWDELEAMGICAATKNESRSDLDELIAAGRARLAKAAKPTGGTT